MIRLGADEYRALSDGLKAEVGAWIEAQGFSVDSVQEACLGQNMSSIVVMLKTPEGHHYLRAGGGIATKTHVTKGVSADLLDALDNWLGHP